MLHQHRRRFVLGDGQAHQGLFQGAGGAGGIPGREVPGGGGDDLVAGDGAVLHRQPVAQAAPGGFGEADADGGIRQFAVGAERFAGGQLLHPVFHGRDEGGDFQHAGDDAGGDIAAGGFSLPVTHQVLGQGWPATSCRARAPTSAT